MLPKKISVCSKWNTLAILCVYGALLVVFALVYLAIDYSDAFSEYSTAGGCGRLVAKIDRKIRELQNEKDSLQKRQSIIKDESAVQERHVSCKCRQVYTFSKSENQFLNTQMSLTITKESNLTISNSNSLDCFNRQPDIPKCEVIHVATVCTGQNTTRYIIPMLKSILFYRKNPLHFHFISDSFTEIILDKLFKTWRLNRVNTSFYNTDSVKQYTEWIPTRHYNHGKGLMKLTFPKILPEYLQKVIVLDADTTFVSDIADLWELFSTLGIKALGLVENQSNWYLGKRWKHRQPWPALGRGFNTGVVLMNLTILRKLDWMNMWRLVAEEELTTRLSTILPDQDITNALITRNPDLIMTLPCQWNVQLSANTESEDCYSEVSDIKIIHWNSPWKQKVRNKHIEHFRNIYLQFLEYNGYLLWRELFACGTTYSTYPEQQQLNKSHEQDDGCNEMRLEGSIEYRTHLFYLDYDYIPVEWDVTLVSQLSMDRLQILESLCEHWNGPISLAIYMSDAEIQDFLRYAQESEILKNRKNIGYHLVYKKGQYYPVNYLRNVALENIQTDFMFLSDIDFLPMFGLYEYLKAAVKMADLRNQKKALVVPAFEVRQYKFVSFPNNKSELLSLLDSRKVNTFGYHVWPKGHAATDYDKWRSATHPYTVKWEYHFEPYFVVNKNVSRFDQRFVGFGWNKVSHSLQLNIEGYEFVVLPNAFIIHISHAPSLDLTAFRSSLLYRRCYNKLKEEFKRDLSRKYGAKALKKLAVNQTSKQI